MWETAYWAPRVDVDKTADTKEDGSDPQLAYIDLRFGTKCQPVLMCPPRYSVGLKIIKQFSAVQDEIQRNYAMSDKGSYNGSSYNWHKQIIFWKQFYEQRPICNKYFGVAKVLLLKNITKYLNMQLKWDMQKI